MKKIMVLAMAAILSAGTIGTSYAQQDPKYKQECCKKCNKEKCTKKCDDRKTCNKETAKAS